MKPIRVLNLFTNMNRGGAESMVMSHYRSVDRSRVQFDFMVHRPERGAYEDEIEALGGRIFRMPPISLKNIPKYKKKLAAFFGDHPEYQIIHGHMSELGYFAYKEAKEKGVSVRICHAHNYPLNFDAKSIPRYLLKKACLRYITHMFTCSQKSGEWLFGRQHRDQLILMRNAVDTTLFASSAERRKEIRAELGLDDHFVVGHVGRFDLQKNHTFLLDIFKQLLEKEPAVVLLLVGDGSLRKTIESKADRLGISDHIRFLGIRPDIPDLMQAMDLFLFPSLFEGFPVTVVEAQASGLPCLLADTISDEIDVSGNITFLRLEYADTVWADKCLELMARGRQPDAVQKVANAGYDVETSACLITEFYEGVCEKGP